MILADLHTHSNNSPDGDDSVLALCESAVEKKLSYLAVTDHCEIDLYQKDRYEPALRQSYLDMLKARDVFDGKINILRGMELGNALSDRVLAERVVENRPHDVVLGSLHHISGFDDFAFLDFNQMDVDALIKRYYNELEQLVDWGCFDVLTHLTYPLRYINGIFHKNIDINVYSDKIQAIFEKIIAAGKALEINTSGLRQAYNLTLPDFGLIRLYHSMGGTLITVGSDAHCRGDVGANITDGLRLAKEAGFRQYCIFQQREPVFFKID